MNVNNEVDRLVPLSAFGWEPLKAERKKTKAKLMFKVLNKMCPKSLTRLLTHKSEMSNYELQDISCTLCLPQPRTNNMKKSFMFDGHKYGTLYQKKLGRASPSRALKVRSLLTLLIIAYETTYFVKDFRYYFYYILYLLYFIHL